MVNDNDIYILNPLFRLRNDEGAVTVFGAHALGIWVLHPTHAIILALCNGERTVSEIAKITRPLVAMEDDDDAIRAASHIVKAVVHRMAQTPEEQEGEEAPSSRFPSGAALLKPEDHDAAYGRVRYPRPQYNPRAFLPRDISEVRDLPYTIHHHRSPFIVNWHLTSECTADCKYCYLLRRDVEPLPKTKALALVKEMADAGVFQVDLAGGDILLYPHLLEVLGELRSFQFPPVAIATKSFLSKRKAVELANASGMVLEVQFSIDTDDAEIAKYLVGVSDYPERIFSSIDHALEAGLRVTSKVVVTPYNVLTVPRLFRKLKRRGVSDIRLAAYSRSGYHHTDDLFLNDQCYAWLDEEVVKLKNEFPGTHASIQNGPPQLEPNSREEQEESWAARSACTAGKSAMMICADGKVIPCEQMPETEEYFCGDLTQQSLLDVWNGDRFKEVTYGMPREKFKGQPCFDCEEREECLYEKGPCVRDLATHYGSIYQPPPDCSQHDLPFVRIT